MIRFARSGFLLTVTRVYGLLRGIAVSLECEVMINFPRAELEGLRTGSSKTDSEMENAECM